MIGLLRGELARKQAAEVLVLAGNVGYEVQIPLSAFDRLPDTGAEVTLHTHLSVREDAQILYGFPDAAEKALFRHLIRVNGVGPRLALALLSGMNAGELAAAVRGGDTARLSSAPGIGRRTAERIVVELRDRLDEWGGMDSSSPSAAAAATVASGSEAAAALVSLGYKPQQAARLIAKIEREHPEAESTEEMIRFALQGMAPGAGGRK